MKTLIPISFAASIAITGWASAAAAQNTPQPAQPAVAQADSTPPMAPAAATGNIPDQVQAPVGEAAPAVTTVTNGPIPDTPANRAKYGAPMSHAGKKTAPAGN